MKRGAIRRFLLRQGLLFARAADCVRLSGQQVLSLPIQYWGFSYVLMCLFCLV